MFPRSITKLLEGLYQLSGYLWSAFGRHFLPHYHDQDVKRRTESVRQSCKKILRNCSHKVRQYQMRIAELEELIAEDRLTGLSNRHGLDMKLPVAVSDLARGKGNEEHPKMSAIMIDLDHFKQVNDRYGHQTGDQVLIELARRLLTFRQHRPSDIVCRLGGEEFLIILPSASVEEAHKQALLLASVVRGEPFAIEVGGQRVRLPITVSVGVAETEVLPREKHDIVWARLYHQSDKALYRAKNGDGKHPGRDQVVSYDPSLE